MGQLNWLANISQPEISFQVSSVSSKIRNATISDIKTANKIINFIKDNKTHITFPSLHLPSTKVFMYSNVPDGCSQGGYLVFLADKNNTSCPISWKSNKLRQVVRSTLAAEILAFLDGTDSAFFIHQLAAESSLIHPFSQTITYTENKSLNDSTNMTTQKADQRLQVEMSAIRKMKENGEVELSWIAQDKQIPDCLTKKGSVCTNMLVLRNGKLCH